MILSRRAMLQAAGALVVVAALDPDDARAAGDGVLNPFVAILPDGETLVLIPSSEMGQGVNTSLPQLLMDELDGDWSRLRVEHAPEGEPYRAAMAPGMKMQLTGGSMSIKNWSLPMREAGARARAMLVAAFCARHGLAASECSTRDGVVSHPSGPRATYGELAAEAAALKAPRKVALKQASQHQLIGRGVPRTDLLAKVTGQAVFGVDAQVEGMRYACLVACPTLGGRPGEVDDAAALAVPGVEGVYVIDDFVAVVATGWWAAKKAVAALDVLWAPGPNPGLDNAAIEAALAEGLSREDAHVGHKRGDAREVLDADPAALDVTYRVPYLDHATMEPLNCTVRLTPDRCDIWVGTQAQTNTRRKAAEITGLPLERVHVHTLLLGGGFGRRGFTDYAEQAVKIALAAGVPVKLIHTREECFAHGFYRPAAQARMRASVAGGKLEALAIRFSSQNILHGLLPRAAWPLLVKFPMEGALESCPYEPPHHLVEWGEARLPVPIGFWRSVGHSYSAFFIEGFLDEVAHALGQDPVALRLDLIGEGYPRHRRVLEEVAARAGWGKAPAGRFQGVALHESFGSIAALVVEIAMEGDVPRVWKVTGVVDCGEVVNPTTVQSQLMGGALFGLSAAMGGGLDFKGGRVVQGNFHQYPLLRMSGSPVEVDMHVLTTPGAEVGGIGELGTPPAAPALCNAIFAATGLRLRRLPVLSALKEARS